MGSNPSPGTDSMKYLLLPLVLILIVIQVVLAQNIGLLKQSEVELIDQQQRMNEYPPRFYRLANILEKRPESRLIYVLQDNFFSVFVFRPIFMLFVPLIMIGFFYLLKEKYYWILGVGLFLPLLVITVIGSNNRYGNFCLYPFLLISFFYGLASIFRKK
ncbi:MAG: hypothetical protein PHX34_05350 [Candidatus Shapirobacteria bacterium]|nr:hypothetical protein [Candidatus Shapirobacteria bacterium]